MRPHLLVAACLLPLLAGCPTNQPSGSSGPTTVAATPSPPAPGPNSVSITNFTFSPANLTIGPGQTVTFTNNDAATHTATADDRRFDTGALAPGRSYTQRFDQPGTYPYHCNLHPSMTGVITVQ